MSEIERYIRTGEISDGLTKVRDGGYLLPDDWFGSEAVDGRADIQFHAMPAATANMLDDPAVDIREFIVRDVNQARKVPLAAVGPLSILRDPYSARPYILFYVTGEAVRALPATRDMEASNG